MRMKQKYMDYISGGSERALDRRAAGLKRLNRRASVPDPRYHKYSTTYYLGVLKAIAYCNPVGTPSATVSQRTALNPGHPLIWRPLPYC